MAADVPETLYSRYSVGECRRRIVAGTNPNVAPADPIAADFDYGMRPIAILDGDGFLMRKARSGRTKPTLVWLHVTIEQVGRGGSLLRLAARRPRALWILLDSALLAVALISAAMALVAPVALLPTIALVVMIASPLPTLRRRTEQEHKRLVQQLALLVDAQSASVPRESAESTGSPAPAEITARAADTGARKSGPRKPGTRRARTKGTKKQSDKAARNTVPQARPVLPRPDVPAQRIAPEPVQTAPAAPDSPPVPVSPPPVPVKRAPSVPAVSSLPTVRALAVVREVRDLIPAGLEVGPSGGLADVLLEVIRADGTRFSAMSRISFARVQHRERVATVGAQVPVLVNPHDQSHVVVELAALDKPGPANESPESDSALAHS